MAAANFGGLRVAGFESRRAAEMTRLLETAGAAAFVSPSMREVALSETRPSRTSREVFIAGEYDIVVLMTGVGFRLLLRSLEGKVDMPAFLDALSSVTTIARGPKPVAAMHEVGLESDGAHRRAQHLARHPRGVLRGATTSARRAHRHPGARPAQSRPSRPRKPRCQRKGGSVYQWALPEDTGPLEANLRSICNSERDVVLFTSSRQLVHVMAMAQGLGLEEAFRASMQEMVVGSIGPVMSETLREYGIEPDFEPEHPRLGHLIIAAAEVSPGLVCAKQDCGEPSASR